MMQKRNRISDERTISIFLVLLMGQRSPEFGPRRCEAAVEEKSPWRSTMGFRVMKYFVIRKKIWKKKKKTKRGYTE